MINFFKEDKAFQIVLGFKDVGIGQCDNGEKYPGVAFTQLTREYEKDEVIPESEKDHELAFKVILTIYNEAGYAALYRAVTQLGERTGYGPKRTLGDNLLDNLFEEIGELKLRAEKAEYEAKEATRELENTKRLWLEAEASLEAARSR